MALVFADLVRETTSTTGTGTLTLTGAVTNYQSFATIGNSNTTYYRILSGADSEVGIGTYTSAGTTLSRDTVLYSSAGGTTKITVAVGATVICAYPAEKVVILDASGNATALGTPAAFVATNVTGLPISTGVSGLATGVATFLATPSSANLATALTDETGTGACVFATSPTLVTPVIGAATGTSLKVATTIGVGNATPSASGAGISFPATQSASTDANTLDDYEEGTWTPAITYSGTSTATYSNRSGYYTKVGNLVTLSSFIAFSKATSTGNVVITGLPFTAKNITLNRNAVAVLSIGWVGTSISLAGQIIENDAHIRLYLNDNAGTVVTASNTDTDQDIYISASYFAA